MTTRTYLDFDGKPIAHEIDTEELERDNEGLGESVGEQDLDDIFIDDEPDENELFDIGTEADLSDFKLEDELEVPSAPGESSLSEISIQEEEGDAREEVVDSNDNVGSDSDDFDFDSVFETKSEEVCDDDTEITVDISKYESIEDGGSNLVLAIAKKDKVVYLAHGTAYRLKPIIDFLQRAIGAKLVVIERGDEDIETLKRDAFAFDAFYKNHILN